MSKFYQYFSKLKVSQQLKNNLHSCFEKKVDEIPKKFFSEVFDRVRLYREEHKRQIIPGEQKFWKKGGKFAFCVFSKSFFLAKSSDTYLKHD